MSVRVAIKLFEVVAYAWPWRAVGAAPAGRALVSGVEARRGRWIAKEGARVGVCSAWVDCTTLVDWLLRCCCRLALSDFHTPGRSFTFSDLFQLVCAHSFALLRTFTRARCASFPSRLLFFNHNNF
jgi:hypothetical protein